MPPTIDPFEPVTLSHASVPLSISVLPYGLTVQSIILDPSSSSGWSDILKEKHDLQPNYEDPKNHGYPNRAFFAPIIGRFANRLPVGTHKYGEDGKEGELTLEEFSAPGVALHGGPYPSATASDTTLSQIPTGDVPVQSGPFDRIVWSVVPAAASHYFASGAGNQDASGKVLDERIFAIHSPHGDQGYPGELRVEARFALLSGSGSGSCSKKSAGAVVVQYRAGILNVGETRATPLNLTHHWGFNLSASSRQPAALAEGGTIDRHHMRLIPVRGAAGIQLLELDAKALPTGTLLDIAKDDVHDFDQNGGKVFGKNMPAGGYDHYYFFGAGTGGPTLDEERVRLSSASTGLSVTFRTNQTGVQLYTTNGQPAAPAAAMVTGGARKLIHRPEREGEAQAQGNHERCCAMLEFGSPHATFLHPSLVEANRRAGSGRGDTLLRAGETYNHVVIAEVFVDAQ